MTSISARFNAADFDIQLQSCDGVLFRVHKLNLSMHSPVFLDAGTTSASESPETVVLTETSAVLEIMLQYMYLNPQPRLSDLEFTTMSALAEAVEKYSIFSALGACSQRMREFIPSHPVEVLQYSVLHKYNNITNECGPHTIHMSAPLLLDRLPLELYSAWLDYRQQWNDLMVKEYQRYGPTRHHRGLEDPGCEVWLENYAIISRHIGGKPQSILTLPEFLEKRHLLLGKRCEDCKRELGYWTNQTRRDIRDLKALVKFI
ncbi:hypothetical protein C8J56DRAFT_951800 [Mycena floridula]|nr:hypothetical protein C8J56DRAFT_951800 [Mycena floridula]